MGFVKKMLFEESDEDEFTEDKCTGNECTENKGFTKKKGTEKEGFTGDKCTEKEEFTEKKFTENKGFTENKEIKGLTLIEDFIDEMEEMQLTESIEKEKWNTALARRTQQYGYEYNYTSKSAHKKIADIPEIINEMVIAKIKEQNLMPAIDQCIINEYTTGQGIHKHTDHTKYFGDTIISLSLESDIVMNFIRGSKKIPVLLKRRSLVVLKEDARYQWMHEIEAKKIDVIKSIDVPNGIKVPRGKRISLTFRKMVLA